MERWARLGFLILTLGGCVLGGCRAQSTPAPLAPTLDFPTLAGPLAPPSTPAPESLPSTPTSPCVNDAQFVEDLTLPDGTEVLPGVALDKRWLILNRGSCAWGPEYRLTQVGESRIGAPRELALYPAVPGAQAVWQVAMVAPEDKGEYISRWRAQAPDGTLFGDEVYVLVIVNPAPLTPTAIPTAPRP